MEVMSVELTRHCVDTVASRAGGRPNVLVTNAHVSIVLPLLDASPDEYDNVSVEHSPLMRVGWMELRLGGLFPSLMVAIVELCSPRGPTLYESELHIPSN
ncbi:hypothetical protein BO99DRAFT_85032 [Aspergillus violaceofuscus CBS 115571]|uniref:Uncharacterized protein n=1 Tax=Aspergillus violaceofuscus (strain CBS 115571) TaxID=1450538 RepID=A0A2V5GUQ7_ASPV1|nr:hypothetical protein BO99DRAFT_85032 [Aspergillus violaceofuscus CBS 115571]